MTTPRDKLTILLTIFRGLGYSSIVVLFLYFTLPPNVWQTNPVASFSRRFDGTCNGWTRNLALLDMGQNIGLWFVYCTMATVLLGHHPTPIAAVPSSKWTLRLMAAFIVGCGFKHLVDAYTTLVPNYVMSLWVGYTVVAVSTSALWSIALSLHDVRTFVHAQRKQLEKFQCGPS